MKPLHMISREPVSFIAPLRSENPSESLQFSARLIAEAKDSGLTMRDYLIWKLDVRAADTEKYTVRNGEVLNGYEAALAFMNLPVRNDFANGISLQAAASTFQTFPGSRIMFPEVVDDMAKFRYRQTNFERVDVMIGNQRDIQGNELLSLTVLDNADDYQRPVRSITERGRIPVWKITASDQAVKIYKFGMGISTTYEFNRRASIDVLTPYVARVDRQTERSMVWEATAILFNGDGVNAAAPEVDQSAFNTKVGENATAGKISYKHLLAWLVDRAQAGTPIDTVVGNFDAYLQWLLMFSIPGAADGETPAETLQRSGFAIRGVPILTGTVDFVLSSAVPANKLIGYARSETLEQLDETGSRIEDSETAVRTQEVNYYRTRNTGFRLVYGDTRSVFDFGN